MGIPLIPSVKVAWDPSSHYFSSTYISVWYRSSSWSFCIPHGLPIDEHIQDGIYSIVQEEEMTEKCVGELYVLPPSLRVLHKAQYPKWQPREEEDSGDYKQELTALKPSEIIVGWMHCTSAVYSESLIMHR